MRNLHFISVKEAAEKWNLTPRRVQQLCKDGHIQGAKRLTRAWLIPEQALKPELKNKQKHITNHQQTMKKSDIFMPLTASTFPLGECQKYIWCFSDEEQALVLSEYYYFSGHANEAAIFAEPYLNHYDLKKRMTASIIYGFASLSIGHIHSGRFALNHIKETLASLQYKEIDDETKAICVFAATMGNVLLHLPDQDIPPLENDIKYLPEGLKLYACYILSHREYIRKNYDLALGIAETALSWYKEIYPIPVIYLHTIAAVNAMNMKYLERAREHFKRAWEIAKPDGLIEAIGEHHGLLQGLIEVVLKQESPDDYQRVINITYNFSSGWRKIHNPDTHREVADDLTTTEFTIAMLADRGWSYQEIADHMNLSTNTISKYLSSVYQRLGIKTKEELHDYMLY